MTKNLESKSENASDIKEFGIGMIPGFGIARRVYKSITDKNFKYYNNSEFQEVGVQASLWLANFMYYETGKIIYDALTKTCF